MLTLTAVEWQVVRNKIREEYSWKPSVLLIREVMKRELGFTTRYHQTYSHQHGSREIIYLDFYDDAMETLFRLKYL
jgi:hypothetical protein